MKKMNDSWHTNIKQQFKRHDFDDASWLRRLHVSHTNLSVLYIEYTGCCDSFESYAACWTDEYFGMRKIAPELSNDELIKCNEAFKKVIPFVLEVFAFWP